MPGFLAEVLTWPNNYSATLAVEAAIKLQLPPTVMLLDGRQPTDGWDDADKKLAMAWFILQREICQLCHQPLWICRSSNKDLMFSVRTDMCYATRELEKWRKSPKGKNLKDGESPYIVARMRDTEARLPSRNEYLKELSE